MTESGVRAVVVDDDDLFRESLERNLSDAGLTVTSFADGPSFLDFVAAGGPADIVLLDWKMPGMNGIEVLRRLREGGHELPVIFLTVLSDQIYEEAALQGGAVDFVDKSRSFGIVLRRVQLIVDGTKGGPAEEPGTASADGESVRRIGGLELRRETSRAYWGGRQVDLTLTEFRIVDLLAGLAGRDVPYRQIYDLVHGRGFVAGEGPEGYRSNVRTFIKRIRQKFRAIDDQFEHIENYPGFGYRWRDDGEGA